MGEFELSYFEVNKGKNKAKYLSHQMHNYSKSYKSIERKLKGQKGLGLESVREQLVTLSNKCDYVSNDLEQIGLFLEQVISLTEQADNDARKLLESFSMRKVDRVIKYTKEVIKDALKTVFAALGVQFDNNPQAKWFIDFAGWGSKEAVTGTKGADLIYSAVGFGAKTLLKKVINGKNVVSWLAEWFKNGVENFTDNEGSFWDNVRETLAEGASGGMVALVTAGITAAVIAAVGIAPAGIGAAIVGAGASIIDLLPIGSVVTLEEGKHKLMIFGVKQTHSETGKLYDYAGVLYPEGNVGTEYQMLFNHDKIKSIEFRGYENEERERFIKKLGEILEEKGE